MAFPSDYKRVQHAGGVTADVSSHVGLARQILVDTSKQKLYLMDGSLAGGRGVFMDSEFANAFLASPQGTQAFVENGTDGAGDQPRLWKSSVLKSVFDKVIDTSTPAAWLIKDSAMPDTMRDSAKVISDLNLAVETGHYRCDPSATSNLPGVVPTGTSVNLMMIVVAQSSTELMQMLWIRDGSGRRWVRQCNGGVFGSWIIDTGLTSVDIAGKLDKTGGVMSGDLDMGAQDIKNGFMLTGTSMRFSDPADQTKKVQWNLVPITTGNTRIVTMPDKDITLVDNRWEVIREDTIPSAVANLTWTNLGAYSRLRISGHLWASVTNNTLISNLSTDNGATFPAGAGTYALSYTYTPNSGTAQGGSGVGSNAQITLSGYVGASATEPAYFTIDIMAMNKPVTTHIQSHSGTQTSANGNGMFMANQKWTGPGAVAANAFRLNFTSGNIAGGYVLMEGVRG